MRRSPALRVSSSSRANFRLCAAKASRGDNDGGISPSQCCMRGESSFHLKEAELVALESLRSMNVGRLSAMDSIVDTLMFKDGGKSNDVEAAVGGRS
jgi:hypothetical protein